MMKCTGERCPMQVGYDVANCQCEYCSYRTAPTTNYDRIRNMSVEEMAEFLYNNVGADYSGLKYIGAEDMFSKQEVREWLESEVDTE